MTDDARVKRITLVAAIMGSGVVFLDGTVVNVALPAIVDDLDTGFVAQQWIVEGYMLTLGALLHLSIVVLLGSPLVFTAFALLCFAGYPLVLTMPRLDQDEAAAIQRSSVA